MAEKTNDITSKWKDALITPLDSNSINSGSAMEALHKYCTERGKSVDERFDLFRDIAKNEEFVSVSEDQNSKNKKAKGVHPDGLFDKMNGKGPYHQFYWRLRLFFMHGLPKKYAKDQRTAELFDIAAQGSPIINVVDLNRIRSDDQWKEGEVKKQGEELYDKYTEAVLPLVKRLATNLYVQEHVDKGSSLYNPGFMEYYGDAHNTIFKKIEEKIEEFDPESNKFRYVRLLAIPFEFKVQDDQLRKRILTEFFRLCSHAVFNHIIRSLLKFPIYSKEGHHSGFFVVPNPSRMNHWAIVNENDRILSEYYRYEDGNCIPDVLFVEKVVRGTTAILKDRYQEGINKPEKYEQFRISKQYLEAEEPFEKIIEILNELEDDYSNSDQIVVNKSEIFSSQNTDQFTLNKVTLRRNLHAMIKQKKRSLEFMLQEGEADSLLK